MKVNVKSLRVTIACVAGSAIFAGCSGGGTNGIPKINSTNPLTSGTLQLAVGTANLYGTGTGLNLVSTYRQAGGLSNVLVDTPTITGPFKLPDSSPVGGESFDPFSSLPVGPSVEEVATGATITGTSQFLHPGTPPCDQVTPCTVANATGGTTTLAPNTSTFGQAGGVFTDGIAPDNSNNGGTSFTNVPYTQPIYDTSSGNEFVPWGGPPAFDPNKTGLGLRDGLQSLATGVLGIPLGITTFALPSYSAGTYTLAVQVPTSPTSSGTVTATAALKSLALLGTITAPALTLDGKGGATFTVAALPAGVTEELVEIADLGPGGTATGSCQGPLGAAEGAGPVYYTIEVTAPGTYTLADDIGPNTNVSGGVTGITPSESLCTAAANTAATGSTTPADVYTVQAIGADYPLAESLFPENTLQAPTIAGASGQSDITISALAGPGAATATAKMRASFHQKHWMGLSKIN
jgi:hypothetical protein